MLTALAAEVRIPTGAPLQPVLNAPDLGADPERWGYERIGALALRMDVVEKLADAIRQPHGRGQVQQLCAELRLDGPTRATVLQALADGAVEPARRRKRRPRRRGPKHGHGASHAHTARHSHAHASDHGHGPPSDHGHGRPSDQGAPERRADGHPSREPAPPRR